MKRDAFTLIEFVFVIIVLGILASVAMERTDRDLIQEAKDTILSNIRLTQHLAVQDNKHRLDNDPNWQRAYWKIEFINCSATGDVKPIYRIGSDTDMNSSLSKQETAINPVNGKYMYATCSSFIIPKDVSPEIFIGQKYGVSSISISGCLQSANSTANQIGFDYLGRPHRGVNGYSSPSFDRVANSDCNITVSMAIDSNNDGINDSFNIIIEARTGYSYIQ